ncbi:MAG: CheB methylesterase domain-containing protein [Defluviitaleaceae bacterium]|nr:CheB methylesterase domain-containing protein [Defluviitaleaceae bacterium]
MNGAARRIVTPRQNFALQNFDTPLEKGVTPPSQTNNLVGGVVIAMGASTGGVEALELILAEFPETAPPVVLVIHMPPGFTKLFASRLNATMAVNLKEAETGDCLQQGLVLVAPAGKHMKIVSQNGRFSVECYDGPLVQSVRPSADILFESVAREAGKKAIGVILTGLGADGARGLLKMRQAGARTIGQNKETSAVYGMPKVAMEMGAVEEQVPLEKMAAKILSLV